MSPPKLIIICPLCLNDYAALPNHLTRSHRVRNTKERRLILNLGTGRVNIRLEACPVLGCKYKSTRLDKHILDGHAELSEDRIQFHLQAVRQQLTLRLLAALRASNPSVPMVTELDLELKEGEEEHNLAQSMKGEEEGGICSNPKCTHLRETNKCLSERAKSLENELSRALKLSQRLAKKLRRVSSARKTVSAEPKPSEAGSGAGEEETSDKFYALMLDTAQAKELWRQLEHSPITPASSSPASISLLEFTSASSSKKRKIKRAGRTENSDSDGHVSDQELGDSYKEEDQEDINIEEFPGMWNV